METATETNQTNRELTTTEIQIAIAQIEDRLMRVAKAQSELSASYEVGDYQEGAAEKVEKNLRIKYEIPETVHLFSGEGELTKDTAKLYKKHLGAFVRGRLTEDSFAELIFCFEEDAECDYGWLMVDRAMGFYRAGGLELSASEIDEVVAEMRSIGTRSPNKLGTLPQVASCFSQMNVQEHAPSPAGASAEPSVEPQTREEGDNKTAGDGCCVSSCSESSFSSIELGDKRANVMPLDGSKKLLRHYRELVTDLWTDLNMLKNDDMTLKTATSSCAFEAAGLMVETDFTVFVIDVLGDQLSSSKSPLEPLIGVRGA